MHELLSSRILIFLLLYLDPKFLCIFWKKCILRCVVVFLWHLLCSVCTAFCLSNLRICFLLYCLLFGICIWTRFLHSPVFDVCCKEVRSILELAVPVWHPGLTRKESLQIEGIQKIAMKIILQEGYITYQLACTTLGAETLEKRRTKLCLTFASKNLKSSNSLFTKLKPSVQTRQKSDLVQEYSCNFGRFQRSSLPYMAKLLNENNRK